MNHLNATARMLAMAVALISGAFAAPAMAQDTVAGDITISHPQARPNLPNRPSAGYMTLSNQGTSADTLLSVASETFGTIEMHTVSEKDGVLHMMPIKVIAVPAGGKVALEPGGMHLMLFDAKQRLKIGDSFKASLTFEKTGEVTVTFKVQKPKHGSKQMDHSGHGSGS